MSFNLFRPLLLSILLGCSGEPEPVKETTSNQTGTSDGVDVVEPSGTDDDGDGITVEDGDCDDSDFMVNPAMDEEPDDGIDNDCDGRIDELWSGVTTTHVSPEGPHSIETIDLLGNLDSVVTLDKACSPPSNFITNGGEKDCTNGNDDDMDELIDCEDFDCLDNAACLTEPVPGFIDHAIGGGWVISDNYSGLSVIDASGNCNRIAEFSIDPNNLEEPPENPYLLGVVTHPDGYYIAARIDELVRVDPNGSVTKLASWSADPAPDPETGEINYDLTVWSISLNIITHEIGLVGRYGGFATWSADDGLQIHKRADPEEWDGLVLNCGASKDGNGGWFAIVNDGNDQSPTYGEISVRQFDETLMDWEVRRTWSDETGGAQQYAEPFGITVNSDFGDYYVTANIASVYTVWRILEEPLPDDNGVYDLYTSDWNNAGHQYLGIISNY